MTLSDGRTNTLLVGDIVNLRDGHQYRVLKIFAPSGPIVFKRTDGSIYRSFLVTSAHFVISAPSMVNQSTQSDPPPPTSDDPLAQAIFQSCGTDAVEAYHQGRPYGLGNVHWIRVPEAIKGGTATKKKAV